MSSWASGQKRTNGQGAAKRRAVAKCPEIGWDELGNFLGKLEEILKTENTLGNKFSLAACRLLSTPMLSLAMFSYYFIHTFLAAFLGLKLKNRSWQKNRGGIAQRVQLSWVASSGMKVE